MLYNLSGRTGKCGLLYWAKKKERGDAVLNQTCLLQSHTIFRSEGTAQRAAPCHSTPLFFQRHVSSLTFTDEASTVSLSNKFRRFHTTPLKSFHLKYSLNPPCHNKRLLHLEHRNKNTVLLK